MNNTAIVFWLLIVVDILTVNGKGSVCNAFCIFLRCCNCYRQRKPSMSPFPMTTLVSWCPKIVADSR